MLHFRTGWALLLVVVAACSDGPTMSSAPSSSGQLLVRRSDGLPGSAAVWVTVDPATGDRTGLVAWLPRTVTPVFSRDGQWMAWTDYTYDPVEDVTRSRIWTQRVGASSATLVTPPYESDLDPSFSGDGQRLVLTRAYDNGFTQLITINRDGSGVHPLLQASTRRRSAADWSPDGALIAYSRPDTRTLYVVKPDGSEPTQISTGVAVVGAPVWSPDGRRLAATLAEDGKPGRKIGVFDRNGTLLYRTELAGLNETRLSWSPDGSRVTYCGWEGLTFLHAETGATTAQSLGGDDCSYAWRP